MMKELTRTKYEKLQQYLGSLQSVAVAFSGGVDSTLLLRIAHDILNDHVIALTAQSCSFPKRELREAEDFCTQNNIRHIVVESEELAIDGFTKNPVNRCYLCKRELFEKFWRVAKDNHIAHLCEGSNMDDNGDFRPGLIAIRELGVKSPLRDCNLYKEEIREISRELGLSTAEKPSFACLASRFVYGEEITPKKLSMVEQAEQLLLDLGFRQVRVRIHDSLARIEVSHDQIDQIVRPDIRNTIYSHLKRIGFSYVTLDLLGYRTGSMNETLPEDIIATAKTI